MSNCYPIAGLPAPCWSSHFNITEYLTSLKAELQRGGVAGLVVSMLELATVDGTQPASADEEQWIPLHREVSSDRVASLILQLIEDDQITGEPVSIDGGLTMRVA